MYFSLCDYDCDKFEIEDGDEIEFLGEDRASCLGRALPDKRFVFLLLMSSILIFRRRNSALP